MTCPRIGSSPGRGSRGESARALAGTLAVVLVLAAPCVSEAAIKHFLVNLNGAQETPPVSSPAIGNALMTYDTASKMLCFSIASSGLVAGEIAAHIHGPALPGVPAPIVFGLPVGNPKSGCVGPLTSAQKADLFANGHYVNIHSSAYPSGEIRGQILRIK